MTPDELWRFLPVGYAFTVLIETPVLCVGLSRRFRLSERILAGCWLTACTYPIVILAMPLLLIERFGHGVYLAAAETFAPTAECALLWAAYRERGPAGVAWARDWSVVTLANLLSFGAGLWIAPGLQELAEAIF